LGSPSQNFRKKLKLKQNTTSAMKHFSSISLAKFIPNLHTLLSASLTSPISLPDASPILVPRNKFPTITAPGPGSKTQRMSYITLTNVLCEMKKSRK
jgi:hypothetical protein